MAEEYDVRPGEIRKLSYDVKQFDDRLRAAKSAASTTLSGDAFGPMLNFFGTTAPELAVSLESSLGDRATEMNDASQNLKNQAVRHENSDAGAHENVLRVIK